MRDAGCGMRDAGGGRRDAGGGRSKRVFQIGDHSTDGVTIVERLGEDRRLHVTERPSQGQLHLDFRDGTARDGQTILVFTARGARVSFGNIRWN